MFIYLNQYQSCAIIVPDYSHCGNVICMIHGRYGNICKTWHTNQGSKKGSLSTRFSRLLDLGNAKLPKCACNHMHNSICTICPLGKNITVTRLGNMFMWKGVAKCWYGWQCACWILYTMFTTSSLRYKRMFN